VSDSLSLSVGVNGTIIIMFTFIFGIIIIKVIHKGKAHWWHHRTTYIDDLKDELQCNVQEYILYIM